MKNDLPDWLHPLDPPLEAQFLILTPPSQLSINDAIQNYNEFKHPAPLDIAMIWMFHVEG